MIAGNNFAGIIFCGSLENRKNKKNKTKTKNKGPQNLPATQHIKKEVSTNVYVYLQFIRCSSLFPFHILPCGLPLLLSKIKQSNWHNNYMCNEFGRIKIIKDNKWKMNLSSYK